MLTGRIIDATEALAIGLVTEVVEGGTHLRRALELAEQLAALPQEALLADRHSLLAGADLPVDDGLRLEARSGGAAIPAALAGAARFRAGQGRGGA